MKISTFTTVEGIADIDLDAKAGTTYSLTSTSTVTIIDPFEEYVSVLKTCFDFDAIAEFAKRPGFSILFDGMHGAGGPFAKRVLQEELGFPEVSEWPSGSQHCPTDTLMRRLTGPCLDSPPSCDATLFQTLESATPIRI